MTNSLHLNTKIICLQLKTFRFILIFNLVRQRIKHQFQFSGIDFWKLFSKLFQRHLHNPSLLTGYIFELTKYLRCWRYFYILSFCKMLNVYVYLQLCCLGCKFRPNFPSLFGEFPYIFNHDLFVILSL